MNMKKQTKNKDNMEEKFKNPRFIGAVRLSFFELMSDDELLKEQEKLTIEIGAAQEKLNSVEKELFYCKNPECRQH